MIERRGLSCILLHKIARLPAACVNISCVCVYVCPVYAESFEQMTGMTVRTCAMVSTQRLTQLNLLSVKPTSTQLGNAASCDYQYGQQLFGKHLQHIADFFSMPSQEMKD